MAGAELVRFSPRSGEVAEVPGRGLAVGEAGDQGAQAVGQKVEARHLLQLHPFQAGLHIVCGVATELFRVALGLAQEDRFDPVVFRGAAVAGADVLAQPQ